uniref:Uncharacterized protein n=1 Tax=Zea mays TaxID=4577 RepID=B6T105_MAIZE|nr:hypothetical protein [Zea mays]
MRIGRLGGGRFLSCGSRFLTSVPTCRGATAGQTVAQPFAMRSRGSEESSWYLESQVLGEEQVVQEEPHNEEFDSI